MTAGRRYPTSSPVRFSLVGAVAAAAAAAAASFPLPFASALATTASSSGGGGGLPGGGAGGSALSSLPLDLLSSHANAYAAAHGLQIETKKVPPPASASDDDDDDNEDAIDDASSSSSSSSSSPSSYQSAPVSLLPNAYPSEMFARARSLAVPFNELVDRISRDGPFLRETLGGDVSDADRFTGKLLELYEGIYGDDDGADAEERGKFARGADRMGIQRSDYMLNEASASASASSGDSSNNSGGADGGGGGGGRKKYELKQVELNTIAASFAGLASNAAGMHRYLTSRFSDEAGDFLRENAGAVAGGTSHDDDDIPEDGEIGVPENPALVRLPRAMNVAHERYLERFPESAEGATSPGVLFVVQEGETNTVDQRMIEFALWENHGVPVVRMSLTAAGDDAHLRLDEDTGALYIQEGKYSPNGGGRKEVSLVYYRAGYAPTDYPDGYDDGIEWRGREKIERGRCAKCPNLGYHLAGTKKVQQELARPGALERFFPSSSSKDEEGGGGVDGEGEEEKVKAMRGAFAGLYSLGSDAAASDLDAVRDALGGGDGRYVLKPQREGGGYNYYGKDLAEKIRSNVNIDDDTDDSSSSSSSSVIALGKNLAEFILMERLFPPRQTAVLLRGGKVEGAGDSISELGCFGTIVADKEGRTVCNEYGGWILRTKFENVDEGGVASGFATLSSPYLC
eukprot:CAMPEP_0113570596 /NCGR_PEP_ID=MMETSP0015_2-20120614/25067_1 /TAXON_ID=2838 /ORGANISM="Odontella" /LENGTH=684 /DNA_ID=CAMNT_0000473415 /DNA_START=309 /DNA_END=2363 /DNA_ORIENTATION=+ /assembly_acc=CAM_ASM_000160